MSKEYPELEKRYKKITDKKNLVKVARLLKDTPYPPVKSICIICRSERQFKDKKCRSCQE